MCCNIVSFCFFFQAEDGIRDLVRSRGLGDVYKRQVSDGGDLLFHEVCHELKIPTDVMLPLPKRDYLATVSYTHLTLPTSDLV